MFRVEATPTAGRALARVPGLRERAEEVLTAILDTAVELQRQSGNFWAPGPADEQFMRVRVAGHMISYTLDLERRAARILLVERISERSNGDSGGGSASG